MPHPNTSIYFVNTFSPGPEGGALNSKQTVFWLVAQKELHSSKSSNDVMFLIIKVLVC